MTMRLRCLSIPALCVEGNPKVYGDRELGEWAYYVWPAHLPLNYSAIYNLAHFQGYLSPILNAPSCRDFFKRLTLKGRNKIVTQEEYRVKRFFFKPTDLSILKRQAEEQGEKMKIQAGGYVNTSQHMSKTVALNILYEYGKVILPGINLLFSGFPPSFPYSHGIG